MNTILYNIECNYIVINVILLSQSMMHNITNLNSLKIYIVQYSEILETNLVTEYFLRIIKCWIFSRDEPAFMVFLDLIII